MTENFNGKSWNLNGLSACGYSRGAIIRVKMINFLTYDECEVFPGSRLNVILGPNGTGKSTLTHAICLACGGSPLTLGRKNDISEFVKHGKEHEIAYVEVDIYATIDVLTVKRIINSDNKGSKWFINGTMSTMQKVKVWMTKLSIDMDNLCSFMPQDKVGLFSQQSAQGILQSTLQAILMPGKDGEAKKTYHDVQTDLADVESHKTTRERELNMKKTTKDSLEKQIVNMRVEIERVQQREELKKKLEYFKIKALVVECQEVIGLHESKQALVDQANKALADATNQIRPLEEVERSSKRKFAEIEVINDGITKKMRSCEEKNEKVRNIVDNLDSSIDDVVAKIETVDAGRKVDQQKFDASSKIIEKIEIELEKSVNNIQAVKSQLDQVHQSIIEQSQNVNKLQESVDDLHHRLKESTEELSREMRQLQNLKSASQVFRAKLSMNKSIGNQLIDNTTRAMDFVEKNKDRFNDEVVGPMAMYMNIENPACAAMIEKYVPMNKLLGFIIKNDQDAKFLKSGFKNARINVDVFTMSHIQNFPPLQIPRVDNIGIQGPLSDQLQCHELVRAYLNTFNGLHKVFWIKLDRSHPAGIITTQVIERLMGNDSRVAFYTHRAEAPPGSPTVTGLDITEYSAIKSRYARNQPPSTSSADVRRKGLLGVLAEDSNNNARDEIDGRIQSTKRLISEIERDISFKRNELKSVQDEVMNLKQQKSELQRTLGIPKDLERRIQTEKGKRRDIEIKLAVDITAQKQQLQDAYNKNIDDTLGNLSKMLQFNKEVLDYQLGHAVASQLKSETSNQMRLATEKVEEARESLRHFQNAVRVAQSERAESEKKKAVVETKFEGIIAKYGGHDEFEKVYAIVTEKCPEASLAELQSECMTLEQELDSIIENPQVMQRYKELQTELVEVTQEVENLQIAYDSSHKDLQDLSSKWCSDVDQIANKIDALFGKFMADLQYKGEVTLIRTGTFTEYEMQMKVCFKGDGNLVPLSGTRHSGGERAVSTIMYLMSLQNLTSVPFRIVDEINQGMDERNERLVFDRIVHSCCNQESDINKKVKPKPQYFLVSPKLLPGLLTMSHPDVTVLLVLNGPGLNFDWTSKRLLSSVETDEDEDDDDEIDEKERNPSKKYSLSNKNISSTTNIKSSIADGKNAPIVIDDSDSD